MTTDTTIVLGFTLVELMVVVVIIGILVAIAIPIYGQITAGAERGAVEANLRTIDGAIMQYQATYQMGAQPTFADLEGTYFEVIEAAGTETYGTGTVPIDGEDRWRAILTGGLAGGENAVFNGEYLGDLPWN